MNNYAFGAMSAPSVIDMTGQYPAPEVEPAVSYEQPAPVEIETPVEIDLSKYYFSVVGATQTSYGNIHAVDGAGNPNPNPAVDNDFFVDIEMYVGCPEKNVKLVKRVKFCKQSLAQQALDKDAYLSSQATFVESKQEEEVPAKRSQTQRMLELAGISHPKNYV